MRFAVKVQSRPTALLDPPTRGFVMYDLGVSDAEVEDWLGAARRIPGC